MENIFDIKKLFDIDIVMVAMASNWKMTTLSLRQNQAIIDNIFSEDLFNDFKLAFHHNSHM